jgi:radical SAM superfamily enzyme YgiQ (UPF0313 family)
MPKIVFIEPRPSNLHIFSQYPLPRLGPLLLGTIMRDRGWDVELFVEEVRPIDAAALRDADIVAISTITATAPRAYAIADRARALGKTVLMGGPHVTFLAEEALGHADFVLRGEAEATLPDFLEAWRSGGDLSVVPGLSRREKGQPVHNSPAPLVGDLDTLPYPDFSLLRSGPPRVGGRRIIPVQTSRGCPFHCSFCSVTGMFGKAYRFRSTDHILGELRRYDSRRNVVFFYDDNFTADRKRAKALCAAMIREKFKFRWTTQVRADVARDPELVDIMKRAGCHTVFIGFESVNPKTLVGMRKAQTVADLDRAVLVLRRRGIHIHGMFVFGFDQDDWSTVRTTVRWAKNARLTSTQFLILTPLPGSDFYEKVEAENRICFKDWSLYDAHHAVFRPARFSLYGLQQAQILGHKKFYSLKEQVRKLIRGRWMSLSLGLYARSLNRKWRSRNKTFLKALDLLRPRRGAEVKVDYRERIVLDSGFKG